VRVAVLDNTCNTAYVTTKLLRRIGWSADFIEEPDMPFNHQAVWEDVDFALPAHEVAFKPRGDRYWREVERDLGWTPPEWMRRPRWDTLADLPGAALLPVRLARAMPAALTPFGAAALAGSMPLVRSLREYAFALVLGPSAAVGYLSGRPYAVITMGWEVATLPFLTGARNPVHRARAWLQRAALGSARSILGMPSTDLPFLRRLGLEPLLQPFPVPVDVDDYERIGAATREEVLGPEITARAAGKLLFFHPSRIYFPIKGTDRLLRAFREVVDRGLPAFLVLLGWGDDVDRARALIDELALADSVAMLPTVLSKKRLVRTMNAVDVVVVQLVPPGYSTLDREALACGRPVISSYDPTAPQPHPADDPAPIVEARTVEQARDAMIRLADHGLRERLGAEGRAWVRRNHQDAALSALERLLSSAA
jgi:glycosyltransferase involved in cell wall biosynthesis